MARKAALCEAGISGSNRNGCYIAGNSRAAKTKKHASNVVNCRAAVVVGDTNLLTDISTGVDNLINIKFQKVTNVITAVCVK